MSLPLKTVEPSVSRKVFCKLYASIHTLAPMTNALIKKTQNQLAFFFIYRLGFTPYDLIRLHLMLWVLAHETSPHTDLDTPGLVDLDSAHWGVWGWSGGNVRSLDILCGVGKSCKGFPPLTHQFVTFYPNSPLHNCL